MSAPTYSAQSTTPAFVAKGANLQQLLDTTGELRLAPDVDYRGMARKPLKVPSGARIFARWNARLPLLVIEGGVHDVWIEGLDGGGTEEPDIVFTGGMPNRGITIIGGNGGRVGIGGRLKVRLEDDSRIDSLDLAEYGALEVLQGTAGYVRDSVFSHGLGYRPGSTIWWEGNEQEPSAGNAFLHVSSITPQWKSRWHRAGPLWLLGWDCESWNGNGKGDRTCFEVENSPSLISIGLSGGTVYRAEGGALAHIKAVPLVADFASRPLGGEADKADLLFTEVGDSFGVFRSAFRLRELSETGLRKDALPQGPPELAGPVAEPSASMRALLRGQRFPALPLDSEVGIDGGPIGAPLPREARFSKESLVDSTESIQARIDRDGVARVEPGVYRISKPLRMGSVERVEGLVAAAPGEVILLADGAFPLVRGRSVRPEERLRLQQQSVVLSGVAMVGGTHGILWSEDSDNFGPGMTVAGSTFEHIRFSGQSVAGVSAARIAGIDSNSWRRVLFEDAPVALMGVGKGADLGMGYADKQGFMLCTFRRIRDAVWSWDAERASGGNFWYRNAFSNVGAVSRTRSAFNLVWFASTFDNVRGDRALKILDNGRTETANFFIISSRWTGTAPDVIADTGSGRQGAFFLGSEFLQPNVNLVGDGPSSMLMLWGSSVPRPLEAVGPRRRFIIRSSIAGKSTGFLLESGGW